MLGKALSVLVPFLLMIAVSVGQELTLKWIASGLVLAVVYALSGLLAGFGIYLFIRFACRRQTVALPVWGGVRSSLLGMATGLLASLGAGVLFGFVFETGFLMEGVAEGLVPRAVSSISPAFVEEMAMRGGVVHILTVFWSKLAGIIGGSVPFGVIHLVGRLFGQPVDLAHVVGVSAAGLLLTLLYLRYGLMAAVTCHWVWNCLCGSWIRVLQLPRQGGIQQFEGAWTTSVVLVLLCAGVGYQIVSSKSSCQQSGD